MSSSSPRQKTLRQAVLSKLKHGHEGEAYRIARHTFKSPCQSTIGCWIGSASVLPTKHPLLKQPLKVAIS